MSHCDRCPLKRHRRPCPAQWDGCGGACALVDAGGMRHELVRRSKAEPSALEVDDFRGMLPSAFWEREKLADEVVTLFVPLSGRDGPWETHLRPWLDAQTWPRAQTRLVLADTSRREDFGRKVQDWLATAGYPDARYYTQVVGKPGLASLPRPNDGGVEVNTAMRAIYARMADELSARYVLVVEDDHRPPDDAVGRLLRGMDARTAAVSGLYRGREPSGQWVCWSHRPHEITPAPGSAVPVAGSGFGTLLLKRDPWLVGETFEWTGDPEPYPYDIGFAYRVERRGGVWKADRSVLVEHAGAPPIPPAWHAIAGGLVPRPPAATTVTVVAPPAAVDHGTELEVLSIVGRCPHARVCGCSHRGLVECQPGGKFAGQKRHPDECEACLATA